MKIYLIRHAQKTGTLIKNSRKRVGITPVGQLQAAAFSRYARKLRIGKIYSSPYRRTFKTAKIVGATLGKKPIKTEKIKEIKIATYIFAILKSILLLQKPRNGIRQALQEFAQEERNLLLVSHAGFIRLTAAILAENRLQRLKYLTTPYHNLGLTVIDVDKDRNLKLVKYNDAEFLPDKIRSFWPV